MFSSIFTKKIISRFAAKSPFVEKCVNKEDIKDTNISYILLGNDFHTPYINFTKTNVPVANIQTSKIEHTQTITKAVANLFDYDITEKNSYITKPTKNDNNIIIAQNKDTEQKKINSITDISELNTDYQEKITGTIKFPTVIKDKDHKEYSLQIIEKEITTFDRNKITADLYRNSTTESFISLKPTFQHDEKDKNALHYNNNVGSFTIGEQQCFFNKKGTITFIKPSPNAHPEEIHGCKYAWCSNPFDKYKPHSHYKAERTLDDKYQSIPANILIGESKTIKINDQFFSIDIDGKNINNVVSIENNEIENYEQFENTIDSIESVRSSTPIEEHNTDIKNQIVKPQIDFTNVPYRTRLEYVDETKKNYKQKNYTKTITEVIREKIIYKQPIVGSDDLKVIADENIGTEKSPMIIDTRFNITSHNTEGDLSDVPTTHACDVIAMPYDSVYSASWNPYDVRFEW